MQKLLTLGLTLVCLAGCADLGEWSDSASTGEIVVTVEPGAPARFELLAHVQTTAPDVICEQLWIAPHLTVLQDAPDARLTWFYAPDTVEGDPVMDGPAAGSTLQASDTKGLEDVPGGCGTAMAVDLAATATSVVAFEVRVDGRQESSSSPHPGLGALLTLEAAER
ncbi:MAG: hypothetical protein H6736_18235 [Alphaproteobacteria bacterium]|nr:hypothetical protein [Alphaproteobacteria bacterium]MCB9693754.1 hypothetical protein [Alphaproteobacteria bacterium]